MGGQTNTFVQLPNREKDYIYRFSRTSATVFIDEVQDITKDKTDENPRL